MNPTADMKTNPVLSGKAKKEKKPKKPKKVKVLPEYYLPSSDSMRKTTIFIGGAMRVLLSGLLSAAFAGFLFDSFGLNVMNQWLVYLLAIVFVSMFCLMSRSTKWYWAGFGITALGLGGASLLSGNPVSLILGMFPAAWNTAMDVLEDAGYQALMHLSVPGGGVEADVLISGFQVFLVLSLSIVIFVSVYRKVRMLPLVVCGVFTMLPVFTYNFVTSNIDFAVIIVSVSGILALRVYDRAMKKETSLQHKSAIGGFMGLGAALLASVAVLIPAMTVTESWSEISGVSETMEVARTILSSVLVGERPDWSGIDSGGNMDSLGSRSTVADHRNYAGKEILKVYSGISAPIYLRSWVAFDYKDDTWSTANASTQSTYYDLFGTEFDPESITWHFFNTVDPDLKKFNLTSEYEDHTEYGFITTLVTVDVINSGGNLLYVPARFDTANGFLGYAGDKKAAGKPYSEEITRYFDGVITTSWLNLNKQYSAVAYLPVYRDTGFATQLQWAKNQYTANMNVIERFYARSKADSTLTAEAFRADNPRYFSEDVDYSAFEAFASLPSRQRDQYYWQYVEVAEKYTRYVESHYTETLGSDRVQNLAMKIWTERIAPKLQAKNDTLIGVGENGSIISQSSSVYATHTAVMEVVDYLREECTYTLTPKQNQNTIINRGYNSVETFLFLTKEGYCVQYATAALFLLRELGIPVRYVEGYMIDGLEYDRENKDRFANYTQTVRDYNAHGWIEVWYDGIGWLTYEATAPYYEKMYDPYDQTPNNPDYVAPEYPQNPPETLPPEPSDPNDPIVVPPLPIFGILTVEQAIIIGLTGAGVILLVILILIQRHCAKKKHQRLQMRQRKVERALNDPTLTQAEMDELSIFLSGLITQTCFASGLERNSKEYASEYAKRIDGALASLKNVPVLRYRFEQIVPILEKVAFGRHIEREELTMLAEFWISLRDKTCERFNPFEKFWYGTVKEMV